MTSLPSLFSRFSHILEHTRLLLLLLMLVATLWVGFTIAGLLIDNPLDPERISARKEELQQTTLDRVTEKLKAKHDEAQKLPMTINRDPFGNL